MVDDNWRKFGEIYDLDNQTWDYLSSDIQLFDPYNVYHITTVVEDPTQVVFYFLGRGSMLILDASTGSIVEDGNPNPYFALYRGISPQDHLPPGLEGCESIVPLNIAVGNSPAVFHKRTFYWFTFELRPYGYDMGLRRWFRSECLQHKLHPLKPKPANKHLHSHLLLGLPNGNFLVLVSQKHVDFTMAFLSVHKDVRTSTLDVKVEHIQYFQPYDPLFRPSEGIALNYLHERRCHLRFLFE